jgi:propanol-preferring alcohol dehydrogenase
MITGRAWVVDEPGAIDTHQLAMVEREIPSPGHGEILVGVRACGVCRTDLHLAEGDLPPKRPGTVPGHEVVGVVEQLGTASRGRFSVGDRVGIPWLARTCGRCRFCLSDRENLCLDPRFTGWDLDGGYAQYAVVDESYAYSLPGGYTDEEVAPLLCAGIIGYRALRLCSLPPNSRLGIYGFGGSAHLTAQVAIALGTSVHVFTRTPEARELALELGVVSAGGSEDPSPEPLDAAILFAPVGTLVPTALSALDRGGVLVVAGIYLTDIPGLNYAEHLFEERMIRSVTANTRRDGEEFLAFADRTRLAVSTTPYPFSRANDALSDLSHDRVTGAAVLVGPWTD